MILPEPEWPEMTWEEMDSLAYPEWLDTEASWTALACGVETTVVIKPTPEPTNTIRGAAF